jgi:Zn-dependent protease with chaperone function
MSAVLLVTLSLALALAWGVAAILTLLARFSPREVKPDFRSATRLRALTVLAPGMLAIVVLIVVLFPSPLSECHCFAHGDGHPHLCVRHPWLALPLVSFAAPVASVWVVFALFRVSRVVRDLIQGELWARRLRREPAELINGVQVRFVDALGLGAFTVGLWQPLVVVDRNLWWRLDPIERLAILHHEYAHSARGDALTQACLRVTSAILPWSVTHNPWLRAWRSATEVVCDRYAALKLHDATSVARALISVERLRAAARNPSDLSPVLGVAAGGDLALRVRALLDEPAPSPLPLTSDLRSIGVILLALATLLVAWPGGLWHHAAESLLGLLTHH